MKKRKRNKDSESSEDDEKEHYGFKGKSKIIYHVLGLIIEVI